MFDMRDLFYNMFLYKSQPRTYENLVNLILGTKSKKIDPGLSGKISNFKVRRT